jgi:tRNA (adenine57-N1/adenine58-N1)-methyltransferase
MPASSSRAQAGDLAYLVDPQGKAMTMVLVPGEQVHSMHGLLKHDDVIGAEYGSQVSTHLGKSFTVLQPAFDDLLRNLERSTQTMYPKDIGYVLLSLGIRPGSRVVEAGTGSGALTIALANAVGEQGRVYSYERKAATSEIARKNLERVGLLGRVELKIGDLGEGIAETGLDAVFLDLPNPEDYMAQVRGALVAGGFFGSLLPTTNQVSLLIAALRAHDFGFAEVSEILHRYYRPVASRLRPADTMTAHTGFLIFARKLAAGSTAGEPGSED